LDTVKCGPVVLLALPFRYRYEINFARDATPGRSRDRLQSCSLRVHLLIVAEGPQSYLLGVDGRRGLRRTVPGRGRTPNPLIQHQWRSLLPDGSRYCRSSGEVTNSHCRLIPVPRGQVGLFDGSKMKVAGPLAPKAVPESPAASATAGVCP
jgi:hypothetical protein